MRVPSPPSLFAIARPPDHPPASALVRRSGGLEEAVSAVVEAAHRVVVEEQAADAAILGKSARLWLDFLRGEHALHGLQQRIAVHQLEVTSQLLDPVDVPAPLDLDRDGS